MSSSIVTTTPYAPHLAAWQAAHRAQTADADARMGFFALTATLSVAGFLVAGLTGSAAAALVAAGLLVCSSLGGSLVLEQHMPAPAGTAD